ncbi:enoyl-CoA hydratase/isomerase family protein [Sphingomonas sp. MA1305]|uniref:enoyl-CoA hydratase/isomerase family protein n=1 Tax=Sphingomonas sp. MA1305 TaxID=2479204 RepID=UPI0018DF75EB|nr:enoyl-CoA hydratase/isomerase family protein [Sphingomonas sp. MA1305]MBI0473942.1 enoyl-CoA hydratase/isomerase family protein [Sphingomonas sp. MA1305]
MTSDVTIAIEGAVGRLRLSRPKALHALNRDMCAAMLAALDDWRGDAAVAAVMLDHLPAPDGDPKLSRGFCAGGDIRLLADSGAGDGEAARAFFHLEYRLNHALFTFAKPSVVFMDGITMGGGVGIALPCRYRVATENTRLAMPESGIGLFPDVGGGWYLSRLPGRVGAFLAVTGHRLDGADCAALGLATHYLPAARLDEAKAAILADPHAMVAALDGLAETPGEGTIAAHRADIDRLFAADDLETIIAALEADDGEFARAQLAVIRTKSPLAMKVGLRLLYDGAAMQSFADEMRQEYAVAGRMVQRHDFLEGVRAVIVDKDNAPRWDPATPEGVTDHVIDQIFAPLPAAEAWTPHD